MAVMNGFAFFEAVYGGDPEVLHSAKMLHEHGVEFYVNFYNIVAFYKGEIVGKAMLVKSTVTLLKGKAKPEDKSLMTNSIRKMLIDAGNKVGMTLPVGNPGWSADNVAAKFSSAGANLGQILGAYIDPQTKAAPAPNLTMKKASKSTLGKTKLANANELLQPVAGTSPSSTYYTIAIADNARIAIRVAEGGMSFRAERYDTSERIALTQLGFSMQSDVHMSMHLNVSDPLMRAKTFGSVLSGLQAEGMNFERMITNLKTVPME